MCGFVGFLALREDSAPTSAWVTSLIDTLAHRGPDDHGVLVDGRAALGFRRLSVLDLSPAGHQPMTSRDGTLSLVFNGEIYNYCELARALERHVRGEIDATNLLFNVAQLDAWFGWHADGWERSVRAGAWTPSAQSFTRSNA